MREPIMRLMPITALPNYIFLRVWVMATTEISLINLLTDILITLMVLLQTGFYKTAHSGITPKAGMHGQVSIISYREEQLLAYCLPDLQGRHQTGSLILRIHTITC